MMEIQATQEAMMIMILPPVLCRLLHQVRAGGPVLSLGLCHLQRQLYLVRLVILRAVKGMLYQDILLSTLVSLFITGRLQAWLSTLFILQLTHRSLIHLGVPM